MSTLVHIVQFQDLISLSFRFLFYFSLRKCQTIRTFWGSFVTKTSFLFFILRCYRVLLSFSYLLSAKLYHLTTLLCYSNGFLSLLTLIDNLQNNNNSNQHLKNHTFYSSVHYFCHSFFQKTNVTFLIGCSLTTFFLLSL